MDEALFRHYCWVKCCKIAVFWKHPLVLDLGQIGLGMPPAQPRNVPALVVELGRLEHPLVAELGT